MTSLLLVSFLIYAVSAWKPTQRAWKASLVSLGITLAPLSAPVNGVVDCDKDCYKNCVKVAPGSEAYCKESCKDYCEQDDRHDGLSGSVDAANGETGIFGGSIDGTVTMQDNKPPQLPKLIPQRMLKVGKVKSN